MYRVAFRLAAVITLVQAAVNSYAAPWFAERHAVGDDAGLRQALAQTTGLNVAFSVPAFLALRWRLRGGWGGLDRPSSQGPCACLFGLGPTRERPVRSGDVLAEHDGPRAGGPAIVWVAALLNLALNVWAIPRFGILGAAASTAATMVCGSGGGRGGSQAVGAVGLDGLAELCTTKQGMSQGTLKRVNFFVIGAAKCGTTTSRAAQPPSRVFLSPLKEPNYHSRATWTPVGFPRPSRPTRSWTTPTTWRCQTRCRSARWGSCATRRNMRGCSQGRRTRTASWASAARRTCGRQARRNPCAVTTRTPASWSVCATRWNASSRIT